MYELFALSIVTHHIGANIILKTFILSYTQSVFLFGMIITLYYIAITILNYSHVLFEL